MKTIKMNELSNWLVTYITDFIHGAQAENAPEFLKWAKSFKRAYCFFDNKPKALTGYVIEDTKQLSLK